MSAARHISDAVLEAGRLAVAIDALMSAVRTGQRIGPDHLASLRRSATVIRCHAALAEHDLARMPQLERRDAVLPPTIGELLPGEKRA